MLTLSSYRGTRGGLLLAFNDSGPRLTIRELNELVGLQMLLSKGKVDELVGKLKRHEEEVVTVLLSIAA